MDGNPTGLVGAGTYDRITNNDFGSTSASFPSYSKPSDVAAIYGKGILVGQDVIQDNIAYMNPKNIFIYSEGDGTAIVNNKIACAHDNNFYAIELNSKQNYIIGNSITFENGGGIAIYNSSNLDEAKWMNTITNNQFYGRGTISSPAIFLVAAGSVISDNIFMISYGIECYNSELNTITNNYVHECNPSPPSNRYAFNETGNSGKNILSNIRAYGTYIYMLSSNATTDSRVTNSWNNTVWIERYGYGS